MSTKSREHQLTSLLNQYSLENDMDLLSSIEITLKQQSKQKPTSTNPNTLMIDIINNQKEENTLFNGQ